MPPDSRLPLGDRALILAPTGRDATLVCTMLLQSQIEPKQCNSVPELIAELLRGAGVLLIADEALGSEDELLIREALANQPPWSDIALIVMTLRDGVPFKPGRFNPLGNVFVVERPVSIEALLSLVRAALRSRRRQYQVRAYLAELERVQVSLEEETNRLEILNRMGPLLRENLELETFVQSITDLSTRLLGAELGALFYNERAGEELAADAAFPANYAISGVPRATFEHLPLPRRTPIFEPTMRGEQVVRIDDVLTDPRHGKNFPFFGTPPGHPPIRSYLAVPVTAAGGSTLGALVFGHSGPRAFTARDERIAAAVAAQAAAGLENARLYREVRDAQRRYQVLVESLPQLVWSADDAGAFIHLSPQWAAFTGAADGEHLGDGWLGAVHADDRQAVLNAWSDSIGSRQPFDIECRLCGGDGTHRWFAVRATPLPDPQSGGRLRWFGTCTDVNDQKDAEHALRRAGSMKDELLALVSHELRTPLTKIVGAADILDRRRDTLDDETSGGLVQGIQADAERLQQLIENMLVLAKAETHADISLEPILLQHVIDRLEGDVQSPILIDVPRDLPPVMGNQTFVDQILRNLVRNSEKYAYPGKPIEIAARCQGAHVICDVSDQGSPLSRDQVERMFELFYRNRETAVGAPGLGLGLPVCKRLAEAQGGRIEATPRLGGGLAVSLWLPLAATDEEPG